MSTNATLQKPPGPCPLCYRTMAPRPTSGVLECSYCGALLLYGPQQIAKATPAWPTLEPEDPEPLKP